MLQIHKAINIKYYFDKNTKINFSFQAMVLQMENKEKICCGHPGIFWICQRLYAPVGTFLYLVLFFVC